jgi:hypothetical protein
LCTPTQRTEGGSGVGDGVDEIPAAPVAAGVAEGTGVSSAAICTNGKRKTNPHALIKNKQGRSRCCFIETFDQLASVISISRTLLKAATNKKKPFPLYKMTDLLGSLAIS